MKKGFHTQIESLTIANTNYRLILYTASHCQLVLMSLAPGEEIGWEVHDTGDQFFRFESGVGQVNIDDSVYNIVSGDCVIVPTGCRHNVVNTSKTEALKIYTIYSPPHHQDGLVRATKVEAEARGVDFDGKTTE